MRQFPDHSILSWTIHWLRFHSFSVMGDILGVLCCKMFLACSSSDARLDHFFTKCSARDWDGKDYLRIIPRVVLVEDPRLT